MNKPHKLLILLLMLILPLQGTAAVVAPLYTLSALDAQSAAAMPCHEHHASHHPAAASADTTAPDATHDSGATSHLCCHQVCTVAPTGVLHTPAHKFGNVSRFILPLATLFIPDSPDRPPRG